MSSSSVGAVVPEVFTLSPTPRSAAEAASKRRPSSTGTAFLRSPGVSPNAVMCTLVVLCCFGVAVLACLSAVPAMHPSAPADASTSTTPTPITGLGLPPASVADAMAAGEPQAVSEEPDGFVASSPRSLLFFGGWLNGGELKPFRLRSSAKATTTTTTTTTTTRATTKAPPPPPVVTVTSSVSNQPFDPTSCWRTNVVYTGRSIASATTQSAQQCQTRCQKTPACFYWTWRGTYRECALQEETLIQQALFFDVNPQVGAVAGPKFC
eukprot:GDKI01014806.1.p1 GENE.GDKI01014806.1~~GDKI01014806.1.p1  ORF type:complete len:266 (-),score=57.72 GDKI01014806.1:107-904(-)